MTAAVTKVQEPAGLPDMKVSVRQVFGIDSDLEVPAYSEVDPHVPDIDSDYRFDRATTIAILAGFAKNRRVMVTGYHGTGKSTHIEQVAARLNWPCVRVNLDSHISRIDLVGKDSIVIRDGQQVTEFHRAIAGDAGNRCFAGGIGSGKGRDHVAPEALFVIEHSAPRGRFWGEDWGKSFALLDHEGHDEVFVFGITPVGLHPRSPLR